MSMIKWRLVTLLALSGVMFAWLTIFALIQGLEQKIGLALLAAIAVSTAHWAPAAPVRNAFAAGFASALVAIWLQAAFLPVYFENNPSYQELEIPLGLSARAWTTFFAPFGGLIAGLLAALISWPVSKVLKPGRTQ